MEIKFTGNLVKKVAEHEGEGRYGHYKVATYLLEAVEMFPSRLVVDVRDGESGRIAQWDQLIGKNVSIRFDINAREYNGRWFNSLNAWGISPTEPAADTQAEPTAAQPAQPEEVDWDNM